MKKLFLLSFLTIISLSAISQQYGWTDISANIPGNPDLSDVFFISDNEGWISSSSQAEIYHTTDGGETFEVQTTQRALETIYMINQSEGYSGGGSGIVFKTPDGGENWDFHGTMATLLTDMDFASPTQGYACGFAGAAFSITPEGVENLNSGMASDLSGISSSSINKVWVCGGNNIRFYNGSSWDWQSGPVGTYNAIFFINDQKGWIVGTAGLMGHTENGGENWTSQINPDPDNHSLYDLFFLDENNGWAVGSVGTILETSDGGENWEIVGAGITSNFLRGVHFTSPSNGYVVGNDKTLFKYTEVSGIGDRQTLALDFDIYPNPCQDKLSIRNLKSELRNLKFELIDITGRVVLSLELQGQENTIDVNDFPEGIYLVKLQTNEAVGVRKIIIK